MEKAIREAFGNMTLKMDSIIEEIQATEEILKDTDDEYTRNKCIEDTYNMIKQILEIEGGEE